MGNLPRRSPRMSSQLTPAPPACMETIDIKAPLPGRETSPALVQRLKSLYEHFGPETPARLETVYTADIEFRDPVHTLHGSLALRHYFRKMAGNLSHYRIRYIDELVGANAAYLTWEMEYAHRSIKGGSCITLRGMTHLKFTDKVYFHEDTYDMGALLYEHLPGLGLVTQLLKRRMAR
jgi:hypothetical protein